MTLVKKPTN